MTVGISHALSIFVPVTAAAAYAATGIDPEGPMSEDKGEGTSRLDPSMGLQRELAWRNGRRLCDRRRRLSMYKEAIEQAIEIIKARQVRLEYEAILAGNTVTFDNIRNIARKLRDLRKLPRHRFHANKYGDFVAERSRIELRLVPTNDAGLLKALHTLANSGGGHANPP